VTTPEFVIPVLALTDAGSYSYTCVTDGGETLESVPITVVVAPAGSLPIAGSLGLALLAGACALGGAGGIRRRS
jgi:hypothetical protein